MAPTRGLAALIAVLATTGLAAATAVAEQPEPGPGPGNVIGLEVKRADPATRTIEAVQHCTDPGSAGTLATFKVAESVDFSRVAPRAVLGAALDRSTTPATILSISPAPCRFQPGDGPGGPGGGPDAPGSGPGAPGGGPGCAPTAPTPAAPKRPAAANAGSAGCGTPSFAAGFLSRVWKFQGEVDSVQDGEFSFTIAKVLNLPKRMREQDDELVDQNAIVLVAKTVRIVKGGKRVAASALDDAENVVVHGKLLRTAKWHKDEDGESTPTIRAKKIVIVD